MNKEFVTYEQALALKELGFNELCMASDYCADGKILIEYADDGITNKELDKITDECNEEFSETEEDHMPYNATIPLYQQAFRWFREKHGLQHEIINDLGNDLSSIVYVYSIFAVDRSEEYKTYEEAENACLNKLIETLWKKNL
jgi:hypothetical protein